MSRWIAFDENTASELLSRPEAAGTVEVRPGDALNAALRSSSAAVVVLPSGSEGQSLLLTVKYHPAASANHASQGPTMAYTGFLGLGEPVAEEQPEQLKKWWQRLWN